MKEATSWDKNRVLGFFFEYFEAFNGHVASKSSLFDRSLCEFFPPVANASPVNARFVCFPVSFAVSR
jgi:hypothetical protein